MSDAPSVLADPEKIVAIDPWGHLVGRKGGPGKPGGGGAAPSIAVSATNLQLHEVREAMDAGMPRNSAQFCAQMVDAPSVLTGRLKPDGTVLNENGVVAATKCAVEPVWFLPGIAKRFGLEEATLRRMLFEHTGGMFPELVTRTDLSVFLPPIGGCTAYIFGDPATIPDESKPLTVRGTRLGPRLTR